MKAFESVSTWKQPAPNSTSDERKTVLGQVAARIAAQSPGRLRVSVDGLTGAGKTVFADELAAALRARGRSTARACLDDFKHLWSHARQHGYDRVTGPGYYRNAYDLKAARQLLLLPAGSTGDGHVTLCAHDPLTGEDHRNHQVVLCEDTVLVVDSVFAMRPELDTLWDIRIWLDAEPAVALKRGVDRDAAREGREEAKKLHQERYAAAERLYLDEVDVSARADLTVDNTDLSRPSLAIDRLRR